MGCYKKVRTPDALKRWAQRYFENLRYEEPQYRLVQVDVSNKGKPIYEREPITRRNAKGEDVPLTVTRWTQTPTLEGLCGSIPISTDTWGRYAKLDGYAEVCAWAKEICKAALIERGLSGEANANLASFILENSYGMKREITLHGGGAVEDFLEQLDAQGVEQAL